MPMSQLTSLTSLLPPMAVLTGNKPLQIVTIDFETYWAQDYSLKAKGMNMSEYVRDERFAVHMMALKIDDGVTRIVRPEDIPAALAEIDWASSALLCHNTAFDGFILSQRYDVVPSYYYDTLSMARGRFSVNFALDLDSVAKYCGFEGKIKDVLKDTKGVLDLPPALWGKLAGYCANDNDETYRIFQFMLPEYPQDELDLIDITIRMFCEPVLRVDLPRVQAALEAEVGKKVGAIIKAGAIAADLMSNQRFQQLLLERGVKVPMKVSARTKKLAPAFAKNDRGFRALMKDPNARQLVEARLAIKSTIGETRAGRLLKVGDEALPVMLNYCGAHTTRWSAGNKMNLQNLPRGGELRKAILAPEGHVVVVADSAQIEARVLAWLAEHDELLVQFASGSDVYKWMAAKIYGKPMDEITKDERFIGKVLVLGLGYGMGATKLQETLEKGALGAAPVMIPMWQAENWVETYRSANVPIVKLWEKMKQLIIRMAADIGTSTLFPPLEIVHESAFLPNGLALQYPDLKITVDKDTNDRGYTYISRGKRTRIYGGLFTENVVQALARCVVAEQMREIAKRWRVATMTHDEIVCVAPHERADECLQDMLTVMRTPPEWGNGIPLDAEGGWDVMYSK